MCGRGPGPGHAGAGGCQEDRSGQSQHRQAFAGAPLYPLLYNRVLAMLLTIDGVENFSTLTVNDGTEDLSIPADHVPVLGEVTVT